MGKFEEMQRLTAVRKLCGQRSIRPSGVLSQSIARTSAPISPPPKRKSAANGFRPRL
jgi:hypothetical protein